MAKFNALEKFQDRIDEFTGVAYKLLIELVTFDGKIPFNQAKKNLMAKEMHLLEEIIGNLEVPFIGKNNEEIAQCNIIYTYNWFGKLSIFCEDEEVEDPQSIIGGSIVDKSILDRVKDKNNEAQILELHYATQIFNQLEALENKSLLIDQALDWVDHVETVFWYINRSSYSRSDIGNNLLRTDILSHLKEKEFQKWTYNEKLLLCTIHVLYRTGKSIRFEEFNGTEITAKRLYEWINDKYTTYSKLLNSYENVSPKSSIFEIADQIKDLGAALDKNLKVRFRRINGIHISKIENMADRKNLKIIETLPDNLLEFAEREFNISAYDKEPIKALKEITGMAAQKSIEQKDSKLLEEIIQHIVYSAIVQADVDYAMSSSFRSPIKLGGNTIENVLSLSKTDFCTCVLPSSRILNKYPEAMLVKVLNMVARRMEFNRWHFIAGNLDSKTIPASRHYYYPPLMPDMAEWSDVWHGGHTSSLVRYTIRAPGPALWKEPFKAYGQSYRGVYDIRFVRMIDNPFTKNEMYIAIQHCELIDTFWKEIQHLIEYENMNIPAIGGFTKQWYDDLTWKEFILKRETQPLYL